MDVPFQRRKRTFYMMVDTTMSLRTSRLQWQRGIYATSLTHCMTLHTNVTELAPYLQRHHPVPKIGEIIVLHATGGS